MPRAAQFKIRGISPPDLAVHPVAVRRQYWQWVADLVTQRKVEEMVKGIDKDGKPLRPISAKDRKYRRSDMTPTGKGDPLAPPLIPGWHKSRTISLFAARAYDDHVSCYWRFDAFTGDSWGVILEYQKRQGRDTIGLSPSGLRWVEAQAQARWRQWTARPSVPGPRANPSVVRPVVERGSAKDLQHATLGIGATESDLLAAEFFAKPRTKAEWDRYFRASHQAAVPGRPSPRKSPHPTTGPRHNRLLAFLWGTRQSPGSPTIIPAPTPVAPTRPAPTRGMNTAAWIEWQRRRRIAPAPLNPAEKSS